jgi:hypothetical protein
MSPLKRNFKVIIGNKENGLYISSTPSSAARKAVSKLCADNKKKKVEFCIRETTQDSNKKIYGPYIGYMQKLEKPVELKGRIIQYKPIAKLKKKSRKMKGGVIIGRGAEGFILRPNINNIHNNTKVSKIIRTTIEQQEKLIAFETALNEIDEDGNYHVKMLGYRRIKTEEISNIKNINNNSRKEIKIRFNFKITYQFGGISIKDFLENFIEHPDLVNAHFLQRLLRGILNCFLGLYIFYQHGFVHKDLNSGNIVFFIDQPEIMRLIDWGILLRNGNSNNNSRANSAHNSIDKKMILSLSRFYSNISNLLSRVKIWLSDKKINDIIKDFLEIPNFEIYNPDNEFEGRILNQQEINSIRMEMERLRAEI